MIITRTLTAITLSAAALAFNTAAHAEDDCYVVDYQGAPLTICPPPEPAETTCRTGWYQGAPIEVCGENLPEGTTYAANTPWAGEVVVSHPATDAPPVEVVPAPVAERSTVAAIVVVTIGHYFHKAGL